MVPLTGAKLSDCSTEIHFSLVMAFCSIQGIHRRALHAYSLETMCTELRFSCLAVIERPIESRTVIVLQSRLESARLQRATLLGVTELHFRKPSESSDFERKHILHRVCTRSHLHQTIDEQWQKIWLVVACLFPSIQDHLQPLF